MFLDVSNIGGPSIVFSTLSKERAKGFTRREEEEGGGGETSQKNDLIDIIDEADAVVAFTECHDTTPLDAWNVVTGRDEGQRNDGETAEQSAEANSHDSINNTDNISFERGDHRTHQQNKVEFESALDIPTTAAATLWNISVPYSSEAADTAMVAAMGFLSTSLTSSFSSVALPRFRKLSPRKRSKHDAHITTKRMMVPIDSFDLTVVTNDLKLVNSLHVCFVEPTWTVRSVPVEEFRALK